MNPASTLLAAALATSALAAGALTATALPAQDPPRTAAILILKGNDTLVVERVRRTATTVTATVAVINQPQMDLAYTLSGGATIDGVLELVGTDSARFRLGPNVTEVSLDTAGNVTGGLLPAQGMRIVVIEGGAANDIRAAVAYLRTRSEIDPARIALVGHSEGGLIAPIVARTDARLAAVVLMAGPAFTGHRIIDHQIRNGVMGDTSIRAAAKDSVIAANRAAFDSTAARQAWMCFFLTADPLPTARAVKQPVLILQGATDQQVRAEEARLLERALTEGGNRRVTTHVFADRNHLFLRDPNGHPSGYASLREPRVDGEVLGTRADRLAATLRMTPDAR
jgi:dienelactone hydrolase